MIDPRCFDPVQREKDPGVRYLLAVDRCSRTADTEEETRAVGAELAGELGAGDVVFLEGPLGAGKTTLVRGLLEALGHDGPVRSPTFALVQTFDTRPPVLHSDLYRLSGWQGIGIEDYLETHVCLIEWADRAAGLVPGEEAWRVRIDLRGPRRIINIEPPARRQSRRDRSVGSE
jgi:tRNA threonylcarbamoyladenosine biosynthesis protein TsaE